jgi:hypothetical protein
LKLLEMAYRSEIKIASLHSERDSQKVPNWEFSGCSKKSPPDSRLYPSTASRSGHCEPDAPAEIARFQAKLLGL